jgi:hypothetical protein
VNVDRNVAGKDVAGKDVAGKNVADKDELPLSLDPEEQHRQLIEQFYKDSVLRYGIDSEQARLLLQTLRSADTAGPLKPKERSQDR